MRKETAGGQLLLAGDRTDGLQLAAAIVAADGEPRSLTFVTLDARLALAAEREGLPVVEPA